MKLILVLFILFPYSKVSPDCLQLDIVLVADFSQSVEGYEGYIAKALNTFVSKYELSEDGIKVGLVLFNNSASLISPLTSNEVEIKKLINGINYFKANGSTDMISGLLLATNELSKGRFGYKKVIILISDGDPDSPPLSLDAGNQIKSFGITIFGILISSMSAKTQFMEDISSENSYVETNYEELAEKLKRLDICI